VAYDSPVPSVTVLPCFDPFADPMQSVGPLLQRIGGGPMDDDETQGAQILGNEAYIRYAVMTPVCVGRTVGQDETPRLWHDRRSLFSTTYKAC